MSYFSGENDADIIPETAALVVALARDPSLYQNMLALFPTREDLEQSHERHKALYNEVLSGDSEKSALLEEERKQLTSRFNMFVGMVKLLATKDPSLLKKLGLAPEKAKKAKSAAPLAAPSNFQLRQHQSEHGVVIGKCSTVRYARGFELGVCVGNPTDESNWRYAAMAVCASKLEVRGLIPGTVYSFRVRAVGANGPGPWSSYITLMAT